eukprot:363266-Chlamydomonas_euryale.AAC.5
MLQQTLLQGTQALLRLDQAHAHALHARGRLGVGCRHAATRPSSPLDTHNRQPRQAHAASSRVQRS